MDLEARRHMAGDDRFALELVRERGAEVSAPVGAGGMADRAETARR
jgi:hypothetical protein